MIMEKHGNNTHENAGGSLALWQSKSREAIDIAPKVVTMAMDYDKASSGLRDRYEYLCDYVRYREIELLAEHLEKNRVSGAIAEAGVDMDLYQSTLDGIRFFYPRMTSGGYLMLHDYNTTLFKGAKAAVEEAEREFGRFFCMPLPDQGGSLVILKT